MISRRIANSASVLRKIVSFSVVKQCRSASDDAFSRCPQFHSALSLSNVYPNSNLDLNSKLQQTPIDKERFSGYIPIEDITIKCARSGKPGGQNVNKRNSKVCISFNLSSAEWIPQGTREKLSVIHRNSISKDGYWMIRSEKTREQKLNLADCLDKLRCYIAEADRPLPEISEESLEKKRLQAERASERRLRNKRHRSMLKLEKTVEM